MASVELNRCTARHLTAIPGIEKSLADAIIRYRVTHKQYEHFEELWRVQGMNRCKFRLLKKHAYLACERQVIVGGKLPNTRLTITDSMINIIKGKMKNRPIVPNVSTSSRQCELLPNRNHKKDTVKVVKVPVTVARTPRNNTDSVPSPPKICRSAPSPCRPKSPSQRLVRPVTCTAGKTSSLYSRYSPTGAAAVEVIGSRVPSPERLETENVPRKVGNKRPEISLKPSPSGNKVNLWCTFDEKLLQHPATMTIKWNAAEGASKIKETMSDCSPQEPNKESVIKHEDKKEIIKIEEESKNLEEPSKRLAPIGCDRDKEAHSSTCEYKTAKMDSYVKMDDLAAQQIAPSKIGVRSLLNCVTPENRPIHVSVSTPLSEDNLLQFERNLSARRWWDKHRAIEGWVECVNNARNITATALPTKEQKLPIRGRGMCRVKENRLPKRPNKDKIEIPTKIEIPVEKPAPDIIEPDDKVSDTRASSPEARTCYRLLRRSMVRYEELNRTKSPIKRMKQKIGRNVDQEKEIMRVSPAPSVGYRHRISKAAGDKEQKSSDCEDSPKTSPNGSPIIVRPSMNAGTEKAIPASWKFKPHKYSILSSSSKPCEIRNLYELSPRKRTAESNRLKSLYAKYNVKFANKEQTTTS